MAMRPNWYTQQPYDGYGRPPGAWRTFMSRLSPAVKWIIAANVGVYIAQAIFVFSTGSHNNIFDTLFALTPRMAVLRGCLWQFISHAFMHSTLSVFHLFFNMLILYFFGPRVESVMGTRRFVFFYLLCALGAAFAHTAIDFQHSVIGASGAIMGVMTAYACFFPNSIIYMMMVFPMKAKHLLWLYAALDLFTGLGRAAHVSQSNVAVFAHLGGMLTGYLYVKYGRSLDILLLSWRTLRTMQREQRDDELRQRVDALLERVHTHGMQSLSFREKMFLKSASKRFKK